MEQNKKLKTSPNNDKQFVQDGMQSDEIRKCVTYIREYLQKKGKATLTERVEQLKIDQFSFYQRYPMLFEMSVSNEFSQDKLDYFLNMRDKIIDDQLSVEAASEEVGKEWFNRYVDPKLQK